MIIWFLIVAHYIGDFPMQGEFVAMNKGKYWYIMLAHCIIWAGSISTVLAIFGLFTPWKIAFLIVGHYVMDLWKSRQPYTPENWWKIYPDQCWHVIQCLVVGLT